AGALRPVPLGAAGLLAVALGGEDLWGELRAALGARRRWSWAVLAPCGLVPTPWSFWGHMQYLQNFVFAVAFALRGDVLARLLSGTFGVLATLALAALVRRHL